MAIGFIQLLGIITNSIIASEDQIRIVRSLGVSVKNSVQIYCVQTLAIAMTCLVISLIAYPFLLNWMGHGISIYVSKNCNIIVFNWWTTLLIVCATLLLTYLITSLFSIKKIQKKEIYK